MAGIHGVIIGFYDDGTFTAAAKKFDASVNGQITKLIKKWTEKELIHDAGECRIVYDIGGADFVAIANIGEKALGYDENEEMDLGREQVRNAVGVAIRELQEEGADSVKVDPCDHPEAAGEAVKLALYHFDELKAEKHQEVTVSCLSDDKNEISAWNRGIILGDGQNFARRLMELPSNKLTPTIMCDYVKEVFEPLGAQVIIRDRDWIESQNMNAFIGVAKGSDEPPKFLEIRYNGAGEGKKHFALVGKGICFDAGGICLKEIRGMEIMRADMGGAACAIGAVLIAIKLKMPINVRVYTALCENMPSGKAQKPGDVVTARNGKTIQIDDTDFEGRLTLADALNYAETENPVGILDMATLTLGMLQAVGLSASSGVFTANKQYWELLQAAGGKTGDRVWRMPLWKIYSENMRESEMADLSNVGSDKHFGEPCNAAAFLREFVEMKNWVHLDIAPVMIQEEDCLEYMDPGHCGRPTRTIAEFLQMMSEKI